MDINALTNSQVTLSALSSLSDNALNLKVGQQLGVKVISAAIQSAENVITLTLGNKDITVQSSQPITLTTGQDLKIQVSQTVPAIEFKILDPLPGQKALAGHPNQVNEEVRLRLISTARDGGSVAINEKPGSPALPPSVPTNPLLDAKIISIAGNKIQLQILVNNQSPSTTAQMGNKQVTSLTIDRAQLTNATSELKIGQNLNLEIVKTGATPEFKILPPADNIPQAKIAEFIKQFLPRHEDSPIFLNQLIKDLPQLLKNQSVPQALKDIALKIVQNLPPKEQLISSQNLKQAIANSGLFLEAKLPSAMSQAELMNALPHLIKNESVPQSLQRIAAEILRNLSPPQESLLNASLTDSKQASGVEALSVSLNSSGILLDDKGATQGAGKVGQNTGLLPDITQAGILGSEDFKANLLKFIHILKQEIAHQGAQQFNQADLDLLKDLQNKSENTVAKIVLDQLMSLPNEDSPKQLWIIDIPFTDLHRAETVKIEIQRDKEKKQSSGSHDWSVNITISPPKLDTIHCLVSYQNNVINTFFKSRNSQTTELIKYNLDYLKNQLEEAGLTTGHMDAHDGHYKNQPSYPLSGKKLFDEKA